MQNISRSAPENSIIAGNSSTLDGLGIDRAAHGVIPMYQNYVVNDYKTTKYGNVFNRLEDDAQFCKNEVSRNAK